MLKVWYRIMVPAVMAINSARFMVLRVFNTFLVLVQRPARTKVGFPECQLSGHFQLPAPADALLI